MTLSDLATWGARRRRRFPVESWAPLLCLGTWNETPDVRTFLLGAADGSRIEHEPGQFMTFRIDTADGPVERCYTIASSAAREGVIEITVKRQPGAASRHLYDMLTPGSAIEAYGPSGRFASVPAASARFALIAAGSGVTPMLSILRTAADRGNALDAVLVQVSPTETDMIAGDEIAVLKRRLPKLIHRPLVTRGRGGSRPTSATFARLLPDMAERTVLCCGPRPFMEMVRKTAQSAGVPAERYKEESFDFSAPVDEVTPGIETPVRTVTFARTGKVLECSETTTILGAVRAAGLPLASSCARGMCGTCKTFKHSGEVVMAHEGGIRQREIDRGFILPCVSRPLSDVVLDC